MRRVINIKHKMPAMAILALAGASTAAAGQLPASSPAREASPGGGMEQFLASRRVINQTISLDQAAAVALKESPVVRGAAAEVQAALGRLNVARAETRPWLSANTFASGGSNSNIVAGPMSVQPQMIMALPRNAFVDQNVMVMFPLYTGGRLSAMMRQADALLSASQEDLASQQQAAALMPRMAYREVLARRALVTVARARLTEDQERLRVDQNRLREGAVPALTVLRDEAEVAAARQEMTNAERDADISLINLKTVMGIHPSSQIELTDTNDYQPSTDFLREIAARALGSDAPAQSGAAGSALSSDLSALLRIAERRRPELRAAADRERGARAEASGARSAFQPQVNLFAMGDFQASHGSRAFAGTTFGVVASLPLYNGGERHARVQIAEAERQRQRQEQERLALQVAQEISTTLINVRAAEQNVQTAQKARVSAQEGYRVALERYQAGRSTNVEVLDALAARTLAESNVVQALFQYNVARDQLLRAVGELPAPL